MSWQKHKQERTYCIEDFAIPADQRERKKDEKSIEYLDPARELRNLRYIKLTVTLTVIGSVWTIIKGLVKEPEEFEIGRWV